MQVVSDKKISPSRIPETWIPFFGLGFRNVYIELSLLFDGIYCSYPFFLCDSYVKDTVFMHIHIITSGLWLIRENLNDMFVWGKSLWLHFLKGAYLFHRTSRSNICLKSTVLNARK